MEALRRFPWSFPFSREARYTKTLPSCRPPLHFSFNKSVVSPIKETHCLGRDFINSAIFFVWPFTLCNILSVNQHRAFNCAKVWKKKRKRESCWENLTRKIYIFRFREISLQSGTLEREKMRNARWDSSKSHMKRGRSKLFSEFDNVLVVRQINPVHHDLIHIVRQATLARGQVW